MGAELENFRNIVGGEIGVVVTKPNEPALMGTFNKLQPGGEDRNARAFCPHQRPRQMESVFRQEFIEIVAGDPARNSGISFTHLRGVSVANFRQPPVNLGATAALAKNHLEIAGARAAHFHPGAVIKQDIEFLDVIDGLTSHQRVGAARVVSDHSAQGATAVRSRVGREGEPMRFGLGAQNVQHYPGLHAGISLGRVELQNLVHVLAEVDHQGDVTALPGQARPGSAR